MKTTIHLAGLFLLAIFAGGAGEPAGAAPALAMHGEPALAPDHDHWPYADPAAPKGGTLRLCLPGTFDSLNPFNLKAGSTAQGMIGLVFEPLMVRSLDEPFTVYSHIARDIETDADRSFVAFRLDPAARFSDGTPVSTEDVLFSFNLLKEKGRPQQRAAFRLVKAVTLPDAETIRFDLTGAGDRELPLFLALMPVLPRKGTDAEHFDQASLSPPLASGPYRVTSVEPGQRLVLERNADYWAKDRPSRRGMYNFDRVAIDYYRDGNSLFEAFKAGLCDFRLETDPTRWLSGYDIPAVADGRIIRTAVPSRLPKGLEGLAFNTRRPLFADVRVREALSDLFDFEWINRNLYGGLYRRTPSFFAESELSSVGHPASPAEDRLLAPFPGAVRDDMRQGTWRPPVSDASGRDRALARMALELMARAGYRLAGTTLVDPAGAPVGFEIMVVDRYQERLAASFAQSVARIGIAVSVRLVDEVQYQRRRQNFDFDIMFGTWTASPSPGAEQRSRWTSPSATQNASFNLPGVVSPAVDAAVAAILAARTTEDFVAAVRVLDRLLLSGFYVIPLFHTEEQWIAYAATLGRPDHVPLFGINAMTPVELWWRRPPS